MPQTGAEASSNFAFAVTHNGEEKSNGNSKLNPVHTAQFPLIEPKSANLSLCRSPQQSLKSLQNKDPKGGVHVVAVRLS
jgi:hypothetical protein